MKHTKLLLTWAAVATCAIFTFQIWASAQADEASPRSDTTTASKVAWEHLALQHDATKGFATPDLSGKIVSLGRDGWELVSVLNFNEKGTTVKTVYYFKRAL